MHNSKTKKFLPVLLTLAALLTICAISALFVVSRYRDFTYQAFPSTETADELNNPYQGIYRICGFRLSDENDALAQLEEAITKSEDHRLALVEINLNNYADSDISEIGLQQLDTVLSRWSQTNKHLVLRFMYDWHGKNLETEPDSLDQIVTHMKQVAPYINKYADTIYVLQGIFIGSWGEMHSSKYVSAENFIYLANLLYELTDPSIYLSVRTPGQWKTIVGYDPENGQFPAYDGSLASRLGLFNDGMLGSSTDLGTYKSGDLREEGIAFQDNICDYVPNGGEVVKDNPYNDFENAVSDLRRMHVSYINSKYDKNVLNKWSESTYYGDEECFNGVDGYTYIREHLGYRYVLRSSNIEFNTWSDDTAFLYCVIENVGFGTCLRSMNVSFLIEDAATSSIIEYPVGSDIRKLVSEEKLCFTANLPIRDYADGEYRVYLKISDQTTDELIKLATDLDQTDNGVLIGEFTVSSYR